MNHSIYLLFLFALLLPISLSSQTKRKAIKQRFKAGLKIGVTTTQIDGDNFAGFDKKGIQGGLFVETVLNHQTSISSELLYTPRGSKIESRKGGAIKNRIIHFDYMEVPFLIKHLLHPKEETTFIEAGFSYSRLFNTRIEEPSIRSEETSFQVLSETFRSNEVSFITGIGYQFSKHIAFKFRSSFAVIPFYKNAETVESAPVGTLNLPPPSGQIKSLRNYQLSILGMFTF